MRDEYPVRRLCAVFAVLRSGYYAWDKAPGCVRARRDRERRGMIDSSLGYQSPLDYKSTLT